ncbi:hypothetical protein HU200_038602 [Digitaria exilis]|uniref:Uncharacterized protein n=1 Tax=Digitaria exilis TaxID=1010633 RepID=A0A835EKD2_9POAL|nr:hypothetical protein HU200_038602 [Digitaria exilis]
MEAYTGGVRIVSRRLVRPEPPASSQGGAKIATLTPWDLQYISVDYIQKGVLLPKPPTAGVVVADELASSFARALGRFYPLAGRFAVTKIIGGDGITRLAVSLCFSDDDEAGAEFIYAVAPEVTASDITGPVYSPATVLRSFFPMNGLLCGDAMLEPHPVLAAQVTELADAVFVAVALNHAAADGTTFWHFFNTWSEINRNGGSACELSTPPPVLDRWFPDTCAVPVALPYGKVEDIIRRVESSSPPPVRERFFHFSTESVKNLKAKANTEVFGIGNGVTAATAISSFQVVLAHLWRAACRARGLAPHRETTCLLPVGCRGRIKGLPEHYMGSAVALGVAKATVSDVLSNGLSWTAWQLNQAVASFDEAKTKGTLSSWHQKPHILYLEASGDPADMVIAASPRFDVYGNDFGWGAPVAVRSGAGNKLDGVVTVYQGHEGGGSIGVEVCMSPEVLARLDADGEFMEAVHMA